jgi:hypothetical protein
MLRLLCLFEGCASHALLCGDGSFDRSIQVVIDDGNYVRPLDFGKSLLKNGGKRVTSMMLIAGG